MPTIQIEAEVPPDKLMQAVRQMSLAELEQFIKEVLALQAQRKAPSLAASEAELLLRISEGLPSDLAQRYGELVNKRDLEKLTAEEHAELLRLSDQVEQLEAERVRYLAALAQLRHKPLGVLAAELGIDQPSPYA